MISVYFHLIWPNRNQGDEWNFFREKVNIENE